MGTRTRVSLVADARWTGVDIERVVLAPGENRVRLQRDYGIVITESGSGVLRCAGREDRCTRRRGCVLGPASLWTAEATSTGGWSYTALSISQSTWRRLAEHSGVGEHAPQRGAVFTIGRAGVEAGRRVVGAIEDERRLTQGIGALLDLIVAPAHSRYASTNIGMPPAIVRARTDLERLSRRIPTSQLARSVAVSACHFIRVFRDAVGVAPGTYATLVRLGRAEQLLRDGHPIADVADRAGFYDQSHLNRCFRRVLGITPGEYRKAYVVHDPPAITLDTFLAYRLRTGDPLLRRWAQLRRSKPQDTPTARRGTA